MAANITVVSFCSEARETRTGEASAGAEEELEVEEV
jgi:hypothetical protein